MEIGGTNLSNVHPIRTEEVPAIQADLQRRAGSIQEAENAVRTQQVARLIGQADAAELESAKAQGIGTAGKPAVSPEIIAEKRAAAERAKLELLRHLTEQDLESIREACARAVVQARGSSNQALKNAAAFFMLGENVDGDLKKLFGDELGRMHTALDAYNQAQSERNRAVARASQLRLAGLAIGWWHMADRAGVPIVLKQR